MAGLDAPLKTLIGAPADKLKRERGIQTVADLLRFWPRRYVSYDTNLEGMRPGDYAVFVATVVSSSSRTLRSKPGQKQRRMLTVTITDGQTEMDVAFFSVYGHEGKLVSGTRAIFAGQVSVFNKRLQLAHPDYQVIGEHESLDSSTLLPIYTRIPKLQNWTIASCVAIVLDHLEDLADPIPASVRQAHDLVDRTMAIRMLHRPTSYAQVEKARQRMRFEEALVLQAALAGRRAEQALVTTTPRRPGEGGLLSAFDARLPFELTAGQREVGQTIASELGESTPMHRLLQGEVGSGKTVIALRAMLAAVDAGGQSALLAPTEVLAAQHHRSITGMLGGLASAGMLPIGADGVVPTAATKVTLLTGSQSAATRRKNLLDIASGEAGIVIGTHALLQDKVDFADLALVVVDEQHRFGVEQRDALRAKGIHPPHVLVMTATPIPRTVAMTVFGDMATSTLRELPKGRAPITTHVVDETKPGWLARTWARIAEEVAAGRQAYVVCPRITPDSAESDGLALVTDEPAPASEVERWEDAEAPSAPKRPMRSVQGTIEQLRAEPSLAGVRIAELHGQMSADDKDATMTAFARGEVDVLVATTVIEVGVDVPNASVMVILDADRFGVSQLHQLRGRVGRGGHPGLCLLVHGADNELSLERLDAVAGTTDGFELARVDLAQRREGDVLGAAQHGRNSLEFLSLIRDEDVVAQAREVAFEIVAADPTLADVPELRDAITTRLDESQAAFLERG